MSITSITRRGADGLLCKLANLIRRRGRAIAIAAVMAVALSGQTTNPYSIHEKARYADAALVQFVRPGLTITINSAAISANGTVTVTYTLTDPNGLPLDTAGVNTPGTISLSYVAAVIPNGQEDYMTYTTRSATGTLLGTIQQPGADGRLGGFGRTRAIYVYVSYEGPYGV